MTMAATKFDSVTTKARTPNGTMFVTVLESDGFPCEVIIHAGKSGGAVFAWAHALSRTLTMLLRKGAGINDLLEVLSNHTTSEQTSLQDDGSRVRSGVDGVAYCLMEYRRMKFRELRSVLDGEDEGYRPPQLVR